MAVHDITRLWMDLGELDKEISNQAALAERQKVVAASMARVLLKSGVHVLGTRGLWDGQDGVAGSAERGSLFIQGTRLIEINSQVGIGLRNAAGEPRSSKVELVAGHPYMESALHADTKVLVTSDGSRALVKGLANATSRHLEITESFVDHIESHSITFDDLNLRQPRLPKVIHYSAPPADQIIDLSHPDNRSQVIFF